MSCSLFFLFTSSYSILVAVYQTSFLKPIPPIKFKTPQKKKKKKKKSQPINKKVMKNIVQYLRVRNWFSFLNVAIRIRSCKRSPFLQYNNNSNPQTNEKANWMNEWIYIGERKKENLLFAFEVLRGLDPKKISEGSSYSPRSQVGSTSKASHGIANEGPHISQCSSPTARHRC